MENTSAENKKNKATRIVTGVIISIISLVCIFAGGVPLFFFLMVILFLATREYVLILRNKGFHPSLSLICATSLVFGLLIFFRRFDLVPCVLAFAIMASFLVVLFMGRQPYIANVATTALGFMYGGWLPCHILLLRQINSESVNFFVPGLNDGLYYLLYTFLIVVATDIGAYYFGSKFGKTKLSKVISPKKTVEGAVGGGLFAIFVSAFGVFYTNLTLLEAVIGGLLITVFAQFGDLSESLIKRDAGVKDSSNILPGHGGLLDRADSYVFALPVAYYYLFYFTSGNNVILDLVTYIQKCV